MDGHVFYKSNALKSDAIDCKRYSANRQTQTLPITQKKPTLPNAKGKSLITKDTRMNRSCKWQKKTPQSNRIERNDYVRSSTVLLLSFCFIKANVLRQHDFLCVWYASPFNIFQGVRFEFSFFCRFASWLADCFIVYKQKMVVYLFSSCKLWCCLEGDVVFLFSSEWMDASEASSKKIW